MPSSFIYFDIIPIVPILAAGSPKASQIWRQKTEVEVLPFVPVTATIFSGCLGKKAFTISVKASLGSSAIKTQKPSGKSGSFLLFLISTATAPFSSARGIKSSPFAATPFNAANKKPALTALESSVAPNISTLGLFTRVPLIFASSPASMAYLSLLFSI